MIDERLGYKLSEEQLASQCPHMTEWGHANNTTVDGVMRCKDCGDVMWMSIEQRTKEKEVALQSLKKKLAELGEDFATVGRRLRELGITGRMEPKQSPIQVYLTEHCRYANPRVSPDIILVDVKDAHGGIIEVQEATPPAVWEMHEAFEADKLAKTTISVSVS